LKESPNNKEMMHELAGLYKKLPTAQGGSLERAEIMEKRMRE
jgi:hypothetical protein